MYKTRLNRISQGCVITKITEFVPNHQKIRLSDVETPIKTNQAINVVTDTATASA